MATRLETKVVSSIQEGIEVSDIDYYDVLVIGRTGMGKSTTADKLVVANLTGADYSGEQHSDEVVEGERRMTASNLSLWLIPGAESTEESKHLRALQKFQAFEKPHEELNAFYQISDKPTNHCHLISNETTKIRVLDVPGFFGESNAHEGSEPKTSERAITAGLGIMREVLCIQATMRMNFKRILYFIPERGALVRPHMNLQMEVELMVHFFGKSIFDCMVLITTVSPDVYEFISPDVVPFKDDAMKKTRRNFKVVLSRVLPEDDQLPADKPPIVFISMHDSCEYICKKIMGAHVIFDGWRLAFDSRTCSRCAIKAKFLENGEKVACYMGEDPSRSIPYSESLCHPMIISKHWKITKIVGGIAHFVTRYKFLEKWPDFENPDDEVCINCREVPGTHGCQKINTLHEYKKGQKLAFDHSCNPKENVVVVFANNP